MKRDMDLIRLLLLEREGDEEAEKRIKADYDEKTIVSHWVLMIEAGFAHGQVVGDEQGDPLSVYVQRLTWEGYEFLESIRNETTWNKAKEAVVKTGTGWTMPILKEVLKAIIIHHIPGLGGSGLP